MEIIGKVVVYILGMTINTILRGFVISKLWNLLIVSQFKIFEISMIQGIILSFAVGVLTEDPFTVKKEMKPFERILFVFLYNSAALMFVYIYSFILI